MSDFYAFFENHPRFKHYAKIFASIFQSQIAKHPDISDRIVDKKTMDLYKSALNSIPIALIFGDLPWNQSKKVIEVDIGKAIGKFRHFDRFLGKSVCLSIQTKKRVRQSIVVKRYKDNFFAYFLRELYILLKLQDLKCIPALIDFDMATLTLYFHDMPTTLLHARLSQFDRKSLITMMTQAVEILAKVHERNIALIDFSANNLLLDKSGQLYLDNLSCAVDFENKKMCEFVHVDKFNYTCPQILSHYQTNFSKVFEIDWKAADVYSLVATFYMLFYGGYHTSYTRVMSLDEIINHHSNIIFKECENISLTNLLISNLKPWKFQERPNLSQLSQALTLAFAEENAILSLKNAGQK